MTAPAHRRPRRGRMAVAVIVAVVLVVAGLALFVTAGSNRSSDPTQAIAGGPSATTPYAPDPPPPAGAAVGDPVSTPGSDAGAPSGPAVPPTSEAGAPAVPVPSSGAPAPGTGPGTPNGAGPGAAVPGQPGSSNDGTAPGGPAPGAVVPGQPGSSGNVAPGTSGTTGGAAPGGPAGSFGNPGTAAPSGPGGGSSGVSASARTAALSGAPAMMPAGTIALPSLGVGPVGIGPSCAEPDGILEPPSNPGPMTCAWRGSVPLDSTSGMFTEASHVNYNGRQGAFSRLSQLRPGDPVYTASSNGRVQAWVITREYARSKALPLDTSAFLGPDGPRALALISCGGKLTGRSYDDNILAFASPV